MGGLCRPQTLNSLKGFSKHLKKKFIYLAVPCLSGGMQDLRNLHCGMRDLKLQWQHGGSSSLTRKRTKALCVGSMES